MARNKNSFWEYALERPATAGAWGSHVSLIRKNVLARSRVESLDDLKRHAQDFRLDVTDAELSAIWRALTMARPGTQWPNGAKSIPHLRPPQSVTP